jgi:hypothetical protein
MTRLEFPPHFPPTDPWKKFFIGVRWLGPDLSFFAALKHQQGNRTAESMAVWSNRELDLAQAIGSVLARALGWKSPYFLPEDMVDVVFHGPSFDFTDPESAFDDVVGMLDARFGIKPTDEFWHHHSKGTFGSLIAGLVTQSAA